MKGLTVPEFAKILMVATSSVDSWRKGNPMNSHMAMLIKAFFPDAPVHSLGGPAARISEPMPTQTRSPAMYKFVFRLGGLIDDLAHPDALARARGIGLGRKWRAAPGRPQPTSEGPQPPQP